MFKKPKKKRKKKTNKNKNGMQCKVHQNTLRAKKKKLIHKMCFMTSRTPRGRSRNFRIIKIMH